MAKEQHPRRRDFTAGISGNTARSMATTASRFSSNMCQRALDSTFANQPTPGFGVFDH
jgi:hypothetical protein